MSNDKKIFKVLVVQLARMGDILQTTPVLFGLRQKFPGAQIDVVVRKSFRDILVGNPFINNVIELDSMHILENLLNRKGSLVESTSRLKEFISKIEEEKYDLVYNLTFSLSSSYFTWLISKGNVYGLTRSSDGYYTARDEWSKYFVGNVLNDGLNRKHIVDIFRNICGVEDHDTSLYVHMPLASKQWFNSELARHGIGPSDRLIAIQPGASRVSKRWDADNFALLIRELIKLDDSFSFVIVGSRNEEKIGAHIIDKAGSKKVFSYVGKTNLQELSGILSRSELLVSNDTGTLHIATALDVPVICVSVGPSSVYESGPYSFTKNYTITPRLSCYPCDYQTKCNLNNCKSLIPVDAVFELSKAILTNAEPKINFRDAQFDVYKGEVTTVKTDMNKQYSGIKYHSLRGKIASTEEIVSSIYSSLWNYTFNGYDERILNFDNFPNQETVKELSSLIELLDKLQHLADIGVRYSDLLLKELDSEQVALDNVQHIGQKMTVVDENVMTLGSVSNYLLPLTNIFKVHRECLENIDIKDITELTKNNYTRLKASCAFVCQMLLQVVNSSANVSTGSSATAYLNEKEASNVK